MADREVIKQELSYHVEGDILFDRMSRHAYSVDASIYEVPPLGCVAPKRRQDVINTILIAHKHQISVTGRGAGTGIAGGSIGPGIIIDTSRYMNRIREVNYEEEWALCEPGVVQDQLNATLSEQGYRLGPDTSTGNRATVGGMVGNNSAGARSLHYGATADALLGVEMVLSDGEVLWFEECDEETFHAKCAQDDTEGHIYRKVLGIKEKYAEEIAARYPKIHRRASGYNLDHLISSAPLNLAKLICGSEGSLGVITKVKLAIQKKPASVGLVAILFEDILAGLAEMGPLLQLKPMAVELIDDQVIKMGRISPSMRGRLGWLEGEPDGILAVEVAGDSPQEIEEKIAAVLQTNLGFAQKAFTDPATMADVWALRKAGLGLVMGRRSHAKAVAFVEDFSMPPLELAEFIRKLREKVEGHGKQMGMYGHAGPGCMHFRPFIDMRREEEIEWMQQLMEEMTDVVLEHGGTLSGEHGDGYLRSWLGERLFGPTIMEAFKELKAAFDPDGMMNPGKLVPTQAFGENLRMHPGIEQRDLETVMNFKHEGGFAFAVEMCNGNAACRKKEGTMCPSFHATNDERHTTRARAQVLRAAVNGRMPWEQLTSQETYDVLDLCIECKGCKTECPSQVDMAKMKAEFLNLYNQRHGIPLRTKIFAHLPLLSRFASPFAGVVNWSNRLSPVRWAIDKIGITTERPLPAFAGERFSRWFSRNYEPLTSGRQVVLFNDTFNEFQIPHVGKAAVKLLDHLGYEVLVPPYACCGRTLISKGLLKQAQRKVEKLVEALYPYAKEGIPIIGLEPSCILTLKDEVRDLVTSAKMRLIVDNCLSLDELLERHGPLPFKEQQRTVYLHGHCHQKAIVGLDPTLNVFEKVPGLTTNVIDSGCCGMAGAFGYEKEHYEVSQKIAETSLLPAVREAPGDAHICASGYSCRSQIEHGTGRKAMHLAELLALYVPERT